MFTKLARHALFALAIIGTSAASTAHAQTEPAPPVQDYDVFVDLPTAFAYIKLPTGWKFVGKLDAEQLRRLPPGTLTSLLPADDNGVRLSQQQKTRGRKS